MMGTVTGISWTDHTFNGWWGCSKISRGCRFCYADKEANRFGHDGLWGVNADREEKKSPWTDAVRWNRDAEKAQVMARTFASSMGDVFEKHAKLNALRTRLFALTESTPWLAWQLLTKRPENIAEMVPDRWMTWGGWPPNVWVGASLEAQTYQNQTLAWDRVSPLLRLPLAPVRFLSIEPMVGPVDLRNIEAPNGAVIDALAGDVKGPGGEVYASTPSVIDWIIVGGESGTRSKIARMDPAWVASLADQAAATGTAFFYKQAGHILAAEQGLTGKGHDPAEWPIRYPQDFPTYPAPVTV